MKNLIIAVFLAATALSGSAQIAGKAGFLQGPAGFIRDVHEMERSPENVAFRGESKIVEQFYGKKEIEGERIGEDLYKQSNPMYATAQVKLIDENKHVNAPPANSLGQQKLTAQHPGYTGLGNQQTNLDPSDAQIATGPNHVVVLANGDARILNKQTGAIISHVTLPAFFSWTGFVFDPRIMYDPFGQRWVALALQNATNNCSTVDSKFRILISNNSDPTQGWFFYDFDVDAANQTWMDFAKIGFNKDWICVSGNVRCGSNPIGLYVINKTQAYAAGSASFFNWNSIELGVPAFTYDNTLDRLYITRTGNNNLNNGGIGYVDSWYISSGAQLFTGSSYGTSAWQAFATNAAACPPQLGGGTFTSVNIFGHAMLSNCVYRNGSLWFTHAVFLPATGTTNRTSTQWWQVNPATGAVQQVGRIDDASGGTSEYYQSIGVNKSSDVVVTYSIFNSSYYPSGAYNFRSSGDGAGSLPNGIFYTNGGSNDGDGRGGDYSQVAIDPLDDQSMWVVNQVPNGSWETRFALIPGYYGCFTDATFGNTVWSGNTKNEASNSITSAEMIQSPSMVDYDAGGYIDLVSGFVALDGTVFNATIDGCGSFKTGHIKKGNEEITKPDFTANKNTVKPEQVVIYPNPSTNAFNIKYDLTKDERVSISIFSSDMKPVKQIEYAKQSAGTHILTVDASKLSSDVYFAKFQSGSISKTIKVIVVH